MHAEGRSGRGGRLDRAGVVAGRGGLGGDGGGGGLAGGRGAGLGAGGLGGLAGRTGQVGHRVDPTIRLDVRLPIVHREHLQHHLGRRVRAQVGPGHQAFGRGVVRLDLGLIRRLLRGSRDRLQGRPLDVRVRLVGQRLRDVVRDLPLDAHLRRFEDLRAGGQVHGAARHVRHHLVEDLEDLHAGGGVEAVAGVEEVREGRVGGGGGADGGVAGHRSLLSGMEAMAVQNVRLRVSSFRFRLGRHKRSLEDCFSCFC